MNLSIKKINTLGLPYHGLVIHGSLMLPNDKEILYPKVTHGDTQLIAVPDFPSINRTPSQLSFDNTQGFEWRNYAIVADNHLGGTHLGNDWLLYIDPNRVVWYVKLGFEINGNQCTMTCTLQSVFGRFNPRYPKISKELVQAQISFNASGILKPLNRFTFERKPDGSEVLIHIYAKMDVHNVIDFPEPLSLYEVWKLELFGAGTLSEDENIGSGISATLTKFKSYIEIQSDIKQTIHRKDKRFRVSKVNIKEEYDPAPAVPPECNVTTFKMKFDLVLVPEGEDFIPVSIDRNYYVQTNWYGTTESKNFIVRMLYDSKGVIHTLSIRKENKKLNRIYQHFKGSGKGTQGPIISEFNGFNCVINGMPPGMREEFEGVQVVNSQSKVTKEASLMLDDRVVNTLSQVAITKQAAKTIIGQPVINTTSVKVKVNDQIVRSVEEKPGVIPDEIMADPSSGSLLGDDLRGIHAEFYFGLLSNNLVGQFVNRCASSDNRVLKQKESHTVASAEIFDKNIIPHAWQFLLKGSYEPVTKEIIRYQDGVQCWV